MVFVFLKEFRLFNFKRKKKFPVENKWNDFEVIVTFCNKVSSFLRRFFLAMGHAAI